MSDTHRFTPWDLNTLTESPLSINETTLQTYSPFASDLKNTPTIYHLLTPVGLTTPKKLLDHIRENTDLEHNRILDLAKLGAVYLRAAEYSPRVSPRPTRQTYDDLYQPLLTYTPIYVRIYTNPKRHSAITNFSILNQTDLYIAVCKPAGIPACATLDNSKENLLRETERRLQLEPRSLCITTRLDLCTSGVAILTRREFAAEMNEWLSRCDKQYLVWTRKPVQLGLMQDWYFKRIRLAAGQSETPLLRPYLGQEEVPDGFVLISLRVESCTETVNGFLSRVVLLTGKTHQIRLQFAARGALVNGDCKYSNVVGRVYEGGILGRDPRVIGLHLAEVRGKLRDEDVRIVADWRARGDDPRLLDT
ncbi:RNA pseudouridylate synthase [Gracilaria domingensis]|nr:RNA pseudouridylate synthase [Gracilaria domingensis]